MPPTPTTSPAPEALRAAGLTTRTVPASAFAPRTIDREARTVQADLATEGKVRVADWSRLEILDEIVRMDGVELPDSRQVPLLDTHARWSVSDQLGSTREIHAEGEQLVGTRHFARTTAGDEAFALVADGHLTDGSIGYRVLAAQYVEAGKTKTVGGRRYVAERKRTLRVVTRWSLAEDSVAPIGADPDAKVRAASGVTPMDEKTTETQQERPAPGDETIRLADRPENRPFVIAGQVRELADLAGIPAEAPIRAEAAGAETMDAARAILKQHVEGQRGRDADGNIVPAAPMSSVQFLRDRGADAFRASAVDALVQRAGAHLFEERGEEVCLDADDRPVGRDAHPKAGAMLRVSIPELARQCLEAVGRNVDGFSRQRIVAEAMTLRASSGYTLPDILGDSVGRTLRAHYAELKPQWTAFADKTTHKDFRTITRADLSEIEDLELTGPSAEYPLATIQDRAETFKLYKYAKLIGIPWEDLVNDDLSALSRIPRKLAEAGRRKEDDLAISLFTSPPTMADGVACFHADHNNLAAGGDVAVPSFDTLNAGRLAMRTQKGIAAEDAEAASSAYLNLEPVAVLAPCALEGTVRELVESPTRPEATYFQANIWAGKLTPVIHPRLDASSATAWFLAAAPSFGGIEVCFLTGQQSPKVTRHEDITSDVTFWKCKHCVAAAIVDHRAAYRNPGA